MVQAFHVENFGCRAARADGEAVASGLSHLGLASRPGPEADVVIVNTCSVTAEADREARAYIRRAHRLNPEAQIVVTGCYAQRAPGELAGLPGVTAVIGNSHKALAPEIVNSLGLHAGEPETTFALVPVHTLFRSEHRVAVYADDRFAHSFLEEAQLVPGGQTRPNLKIQEGCGNRCTFCVIPQTRGNSRSLAEEKILAQVRGFVDAGGNELVLSGINLGRWGRDLPQASAAPRRSLARLVRRIFGETSLPRLRLSSIEPMDWDQELIGLLREFGGTRLARHAHLPLQSGSDSVLRRMHRRYRPWHYVEKVHALREAAGVDLTVGADVMVGFPGETDREFGETVDMIRQLPVGYLHLFPFSPRPGTRGWGLHRQTPVPSSVVDERMAALRALAKDKTRAHRNSFVGRVLGCITLNTPAALAGQNCSAVLTENFLPLSAQGTLSPNTLASVLVTGMNSEGSLTGQPHS